MEENWLSSNEIKSILKISSQYLYEMKKLGKIKYKQISNKKYLYQLPDSFKITKYCALYARVSTSKQKIDLENQIELLKKYVISNGNIINEKYIFYDIASGMNENRKGLQNLITAVKSGLIKSIFITHKDRLTRFGFGYLEFLCSLYNTNIIILDNSENTKSFQEELTDDLISIIHHFSMKFYGKRKNSLVNCEKELRQDD